ncbi:hypothetical protein [Sphingomonas alpina]|uniref:Uncharacterized protein n=1 Tax=Sphingomonas alpina TaxID=653931 RepID=A0A7H0LPK7_9SPHN|nr:hypothetical protein [Sphingomonas alpina]QNQ11610.1 hypothetical protein H3Z74_11010 [Sphingomonas alpina]
MALYFVSLPERSLMLWPRVLTTILLFVGVIGLIADIKSARIFGVFGIIISWIVMLLLALPDLSQSTTRLEVYLRGMLITGAAIVWMSLYLMAGTKALNIQEFSEHD